MEANRRAETRHLKAVMGVGFILASAKSLQPSNGLTGYGDAGRLRNYFTPETPAPGAIRIATPLPPTATK